MDIALLQRTLEELGEPAYRMGQVWRWAAHGAACFESMTDLPLSLRAKLEDEVPFSTLELVDQLTASDGTVKALFHTQDGRPLEAVLMSYADGRRSLCLSSQSGCPLTCTFCATGQMRFGRNLTAWEIIDQALHFRRMGERRSRRVHGDGRTDDEPRRRAQRVPTGCRRLGSAIVTRRSRRSAGSRGSSGSPRSRCRCG